ncbi:hypothetical protein TYRP_013189 [Tyrophagus putrescentiae]|nr:hypothetical protein TYRP_013189 [Tyrophagus putrescentiae]
MAVSPSIVSIRVVATTISFGPSASGFSICTGHSQEGPPRQLLLVHLNVADGGAKGAAPVDQALGAVDETALVQLHKGLRNRLAHLRVQCEGGPAPVGADAENLQLLVDAVALLVLPLPHLLDEGLTANVVARDLSLTHQLLLDDDLRADASVVAARVPERRSTGHAVPASQAVLDGVRQRVAQVQVPGDVRRRNDHHKLALRVRLADVPVGGVVLGLEVALRLPPVVPDGLHILGTVGVGHRVAGDVLLLALGDGAVVGDHDLLRRLGLLSGGLLRVTGGLRRRQLLLLLLELLQLGQSGSLLFQLLFRLNRRRISGWFSQSGKWLQK